MKLAAIVFDLLTWIVGINAFTTLFNWFIAPIFHVDHIGYLHGFGVLLTWTLIRSKSYDTIKLDDDELLAISVASFIFVLIILGIGSIVHAFM